MNVLTVGLTLPVIGTEYELFLGFDELGTARQVKAAYLGYKTSETHWFLGISSPEGHIFGRQSPDNNLEIYCIRDNEKVLRETWLSDGEDGPEWPVGFGAEKFAGQISQANEETILRRML